MLANILFSSFSGNDTAIAPRLNLVALTVCFSTIIVVIVISGVTLTYTAVASKWRRRQTNKKSRHSCFRCCDWSNRGYRDPHAYIGKCCLVDAKSYDFPPKLCNVACDDLTRSVRHGAAIDARVYSFDITRHNDATRYDDVTRHGDVIGRVDVTGYGDVIRNRDVVNDDVRRHEDDNTHVDIRLRGDVMYDDAGCGAGGEEMKEVVAAELMRLLQASETTDSFIVHQQLLQQQQLQQRQDVPSTPQRNKAAREWYV